MRTLCLALSIVCFILLTFHIEVRNVNLWALGVAFYLLSLMPWKYAGLYP